MTIAEDDEVGGEVTTEIGPWAMVPVWVLTKGLKPATLATYVALRSFADRVGGARPRAEKIAERAQLSVGTVRNSIQELRSKKLIETKERRRADGSLAGLDYKLFDIDPTPGVVVEPKRKGEKPGPKAGSQNTRSAAGTSSNVPPSIGDESAGAGTSSNAGGVHQVMQGSAPVDVGKNTPREHTNEKTSEPAAQVRRPDAENAATEGQIDIDGNVGLSDAERAKKVAEEQRQESQKIAREWIDFRAKHNCPVVMGGNQDPQAALAKSYALPALKAGYTAAEIKLAMMWCDTGIPAKPMFESGLAQVRGGWRPLHGWKPGDGRDGGGVVGAGAGRRRNGGAANENRHIDDISEQQRDQENPFARASRQSDYLTEEAVA